MSSMPVNLPTPAERSSQPSPTFLSSTSTEYLADASDIARRLEDGAHCLTNELEVVHVGRVWNARRLGPRHDAERIDRRNQRPEAVQHRDRRASENARV